MDWFSIPRKEEMDEPKLRLFKYVVTLRMFATTGAKLLLVVDEEKLKATKTGTLDRMKALAHVVNNEL